MCCSQRPHTIQNVPKQNMAPRLAVSSQPLSPCAAMCEIGSCDNAKRSRSGKRKRFKIEPGVRWNLEAFRFFPFLCVFRFFAGFSVFFVCFFLLSAPPPPARPLDLAHLHTMRYRLKSQAERAPLYKQDHATISHLLKKQPRKYIYLQDVCTAGVIPYRLLPLLYQGRAEATAKKIHDFQGPTERCVAPRLVSYSTRRTHFQAIV